MSLKHEANPCGDIEMPMDDDQECSITGSESIMSIGHQDEDDDISLGESKGVWTLKLVVLLVLLGSAIGGAITMHSFIAQSEEAQFATGFHDDAQKVLEAIGNSLEQTLGAFDATATSFVSHAQATNQSWPFVTIPDFAVRMSKVLPLTDAVNINVVPIVTPEQRAQWEAYSVQNDQWVLEGMAVQAKWDGYFGRVISEDAQHGQIHGDFGNIETNVSRILLPTWQNFPVIPNTSYTYNFDWLSVSFHESYLECISSHRAVVSIPYMIPKKGDETAEAETDFWARYFLDFIAPDEEAREPVSDILYPIIDDVQQAHVADAHDYNPADHSIVGMLAVSFYWRTLLRNLLPVGSDGIRVVVKNPCSESVFSYQINGPEAIFMGVGDYHDKAFDDIVERSTLTGLMTLAKHRTVYSGAILSEDVCPISLYIYPSNLTKAAYTTNNRSLFSVAVVLIFMFTSLVFCIYDLKVERRQRTTMNTAVRSTAIVSSLFPTVVRDRLYPATVQTSQVATGSTHRGSLRMSMVSTSNESTLSTTPIAELYPDTTVLFADIAGFTAWSSSRTPTQVFQLLETLYSAFDEIAKQRGIFKVETIGDCYVAAVGLPTPRKHHAVAMARFASDCIQRMNIVTQQLAATLGPDTSTLALRVGLNSGPTTAGVLRGEKSRFQLFGDTVNTASRMESTGERNRIQVSCSTADLMLISGKGDWLTRRSDEVDIKGKGMMTTFWCSIAD